jgi:hypothetical protein
MKIMKTRYTSLLITLLTLGGMSCNENEQLPEFLKGTELGILLIVNVTSGNEILVSDINSSNVVFDISYEDAKRPVQSIVVYKTFVPATGTASAKVEQMTVTSPSSVSLSVSDLVSGIPGLSIGDIVSGDSFRIEFTTNYADGFVVDNYGTGVNPNFSVTFI